MNWISAEESFDCETRHYGQLFSVEKPNDYPNYIDYLNPISKTVYKNTKCHKDILKNIKILERVQFERKGFFAVDQDSDLKNNKIVWNKIVGLIQDKNKK